jgi:hypothetical protein
LSFACTSRSRDYLYVYRRTFWIPNSPPGKYIKPIRHTPGKRAGLTPRNVLIRLLPGKDPVVAKELPDRRTAVEEHLPLAEQYGNIQTKMQPALYHGRVAFVIEWHYLIRSNTFTLFAVLTPPASEPQTTFRTTEVRSCSREEFPT